MALTREQILASHDIPTDYVDAPAWGGKIKIRAPQLGRHDYSAFLDAPLEDGTRPGNNELVRRTNLGAVILGCINEDGTPLFTWADAPALREKHWKTVLEVAEAIFDLGKTARTTIEDVETGKDISGTTPETDGSTG